ncbi:hypothetical protein AZG88_38225 [Rhodococcus sp. LB1]|nr:hypothetical protein AZG88_38225 [Rhodococcus sp. LB1]
MTPLWVPLVVAAIGLITTVTGVVVTQILANRRERASWNRDLQREQVRWTREDQRLTFEQRRTAYVEFYESLRRMIHGPTITASVSATKAPSFPKAGRPKQPTRVDAWRFTRHLRSRVRL